MDAKIKELNPDELEQVNGGYVVSDNTNKLYYIVKQDGTVIGRAPTEAKAKECIKQYDMSDTVLTLEEYKDHFGRDIN